MFYEQCMKNIIDIRKDAYQIIYRIIFYFCSSSFVAMHQNVKGFVYEIRNNACLVDSYTINC